VQNYGSLALLLQRENIWGIFSFPFSIASIYSQQRSMPVCIIACARRKRCDVEVENREEIDYKTAQQGRCH